jgi:hypothetical protein
MEDCLISELRKKVNDLFDVYENIEINDSIDRIDTIKERINIYLEDASVDGHIHDDEVFYWLIQYMIDTISDKFYDKQGEYPKQFLRSLVESRQIINDVITGKYEI